MSWEKLVEAEITEVVELFSSTKAPPISVMSEQEWEVWCMDAAQDGMEWDWENAFMEHTLKVRYGNKEWVLRKPSTLELRQIQYARIRHTLQGVDSPGRSREMALRRMDELEREYAA